MKSGQKLSINAAGEQYLNNGKTLCQKSVVAPPEYLLRTNKLSEFKTEEEKAEARTNLGVDLSPYYTKNEVYTKDEVNNLTNTHCIVNSLPSITSYSNNFAESYSPSEDASNISEELSGYYYDPDNHVITASETKYYIFYDIGTERIIQDHFYAYVDGNLIPIKGCTEIPPNSEIITDSNDYNGVTIEYVTTDSKVYPDKVYLLNSGDHYTGYVFTISGWKEIDYRSDDTHIKRIEVFNSNLHEPGALGSVSDDVLDTIELRYKNFNDENIYTVRGIINAKKVDHTYLGKDDVENGVWSHGGYTVPKYLYAGQIIYANCGAEVMGSTQVSTSSSFSDFVTLGPNDYYVVPETRNYYFKFINYLSNASIDYVADIAIFEDTESVKIWASENTSSCCRAVLNEVRSVSYLSTDNGSFEMRAPGNQSGFLNLWKINWGGYYYTPISVKTSLVEESNPLYEGSEDDEHNPTVSYIEVVFTILTVDGELYKFSGNNYVEPGTSIVNNYEYSGTYSKVNLT